MPAPLPPGRRRRRRPCRRRRRRHRDPVDAQLDQPGDERRALRRRVAAAAHGHARRVRAGDDERDRREDGLVLGAVARGEHRRVPVDPEHELRQVVRADREAVDLGGEPLREERGRRHLGHRPELEARPLREALLGDDDLHGPQLVERPHERDADVDVVQPRVEDAGDRAQLEAQLLRPLQIPGDAAQAEHRVLLARLEAVAAGQRPVLVRLQVERPVHDRPGVEGPCDGLQAFREGAHERVLAALLEHGARVPPRAEREELGPEQADTGGREGGGLRRELRHAEIEVDLRPAVRHA